MESTYTATVAYLWSCERGGPERSSVPVTLDGRMSVPLRAPLHVESRARYWRLADRRVVSVARRSDRVGLAAPSWRSR